MAGVPRAWMPACQFLDLNPSVPRRARTAREPKTPPAIRRITAVTIEYHCPFAVSAEATPMMAATTAASPQRITTFLSRVMLITLAPQTEGWQVRGQQAPTTRQKISCPSRRSGHLPAQGCGPSLPVGSGRARGIRARHSVGWTLWARHPQAGRESQVVPPFPRG